jgi:mannose-1-phosphate guanylyltransferase
MKILIMAGGKGTRFYPLSTLEKPKQFISFLGDQSLLQQTVSRVLKLVSYDDIFIATNQAYATLVKEQLPLLEEDHIIIEPMYKDTAAAITYGMTYMSLFEDNPIVAVLASDHMILNEDQFIINLKQAFELALKGSIITLGIQPTRAETGYGYIHVKDQTLNEPQEVISFLEKPSIKKATEYVNHGNYMWNSGMFILSYETLKQELRQYQPTYIEVIKQLLVIMNHAAKNNLSDAVKETFDLFPTLSIDYALMEKTSNILCIPVSFGWSDVGGYNALPEVLGVSKDGHTTNTNHYIYLDSKDNIVITDDPSKKVSTIGINNTVIVSLKDELLLCNRNQTDNIKHLLELLKNT